MSTQAQRWYGYQIVPASHSAGAGAGAGANTGQAQGAHETDGIRRIYEPMISR